MLSVALGLSGGVMVYISFVELLAGANLSLREEFGGKTGAFLSMGAFFGGMLLAGIIDRLVPEPANPHETKSVEEMDKQNPPDYAKLHRAGIRFAAAIAIHKFPEGLAVFAASLSGLELGIPVALAMALHNIPEGIAVSVPVYYATGSRAKAFWYASLTGRGAARLSGARTVPDLGGAGDHLRGSGRNHGFRDLRRPAADGAQVRGRALVAVRARRRNVPDGARTRGGVRKETTFLKDKTI